MTKNMNLFSANGISPQIEDAAVAATRALKQQAEQQGATQFRGIATEAYRLSRNGQHLIDRYLSELSLPVTIILQEDEGKFGFLALVKEQQLDPAQVVAWDIGGGSFQITYLDEEGSLQVYKGPFGRMTMVNAVVSQVKHQNPRQIKTPNPMSQTDWEHTVSYLQEVLPTPPQELIDKLKKPGVRLIGIEAHPEKLKALGAYSSDDLTKLASSYLNKTDAELAKEGYASQAHLVTQLALAYAVMQLLDSHQTEYIPTKSGSSSALLVQH